MLVVKLGNATSAVQWGHPIEIGGTDNTLGLALHNDGTLAFVGTNGQKKLIAAIVDPDGTLHGPRSIQAEVAASGWAAEWIGETVVVAGQFSGAFTDPALANSDDYDAFILSLAGKALTNAAPLVAHGGSGTDYAQSIRHLPQTDALILGGSCSSDWSPWDAEHAQFRPCGANRSPFVARVDPGTGQLEHAKILFPDGPGQIYDIHPTADEQYIVVVGVLGGPTSTVGTYVLGTGYAALLRTDTLAVVHEWTVVDTPSQIRKVTIDDTGGLVFGGTFEEHSNAKWRSADPLSNTVDTPLPAGERQYNIFLARECLPE